MYICTVLHSKSSMCDINLRVSQSFVSKADRVLFCKRDMELSDISGDLAVSCLPSCSLVFCRAGECEWASME